MFQCGSRTIQSTDNSTNSTHGQLNWNGRRYTKPLFDIKLWNCFDHTLDDMPRTNNHIEAFHNVFNSMIQQNHPDVSQGVRVSTPFKCSS